MFKLKLAKTTDRLPKGVLFHSDMTDNTFVIYSKDFSISDIELKKLAYKAFDILMGEDPDTRGLHQDECYDEYAKFLKQNKLADAERGSGSLYKVTKKDLVSWYVDGKKINIIDTYTDRF